MNNDIFSSKAFLDNASVVGVVESPEKQSRDLILIRQFHGGAACIPKLMLQPDFTTQYVQHHNQIRAICIPLLEEPNNHLFVEGYRIDEQHVFSQIHSENISNFENTHSIKSSNIDGGKLTSLHTDIALLLTDRERANCLKDPCDFDLSIDEELEAFNMVTSGHFLNEYCERFIGSFRMAAHMVLTHRKNQVHGMELAFSQGNGLPDSSADFTPDDRIEFDKRRVQNIVSGFRQHVQEGCAGVLVIGASHTQIGSHVPMDPAIGLFENIIPLELPDTRLIIVEPNVKVWDTVMWAES